MKDVRILPAVILLSVLMIFSSFHVEKKGLADVVTGAWGLEDGSTEHLVIFTGNYYTYTAFDKSRKEFIRSQGGTYQVQGKQIQTTMEFNSAEKDQVGTSQSFPFTQESNNLSIEVQGSDVRFTRIDDGTGPLSGTWRITGRMQEGKMVPMQSGPRKTLKFLSGTRFQWVAMNTETKEFFGTGGGTYTFADGRYTENIDFFSRDSSRVGISLSFEGKIENDNWHHSGVSSKNENIHEVWSRVK